MSLEYEYKLSVVVLTYNTEEFIEECLDSLVNQTLDGIEIICVNDESKDNTLNILRRYERKYENIKVVDQKNTGGAIAGNNGLKMAKGEYITIIDSDDIVVHDAYEKLYNKAKETDSDIVSGRPFRYVGAYQRNFGSRKDMWDRERTIDIHKDVDIFYDAFYWNKIYKREFVEKNDLYMIPGKLYADAPMVFKAYLNADKITYVNDFVYYWRHRSVNESISKSLTNIPNAEDRLDNYYVLKEYFKDEPELFNKVIKLFLERFLYPIRGILDNPLFKDFLLPELKKIFDDIDDAVDNPFANMKYKLYTYLIINDKISVLEDVLKNHEDVSDVFVEDAKSYWNIKYFRNPEFDIPDYAFELVNLHRNFIYVSEMGITGDDFRLAVSMPPTFDLDNVRVRFNGLTKKYGLKDDNSYLFDMDSLGDNSYAIEIPLNEIGNINYYDIYLDIIYDGKREMFRLGRNNLDEAVSDDSFIGEKSQIIITQLDNISFIHTYADSLFDYQIDDEKFIIKSTKNEINYKLGISHEKESETVYFRRLAVEGTDRFTSDLELKWKYSLERNITYKLFIEITKERYDLKVSHFKDFKNQEIEYDDGKIRLFEDDGCIYLRWE